MCLAASSFFFFFNDTATTEIYTLSLHDALPILLRIHTAVQNDPAVGAAQFADRGQNAFTGDGLCYRLVYLWHRLRIARPQFDVIDLAHHRHPRRGGLSHAPAQSLADRVLAWPVLLGPLAIHDSHPLLVGAIRLRKDAPPEHPNAH